MSGLSGLFTVEHIGDRRLIVSSPEFLLSKGGIKGFQPWAVLPGTKLIPFHQGLKIEFNKFADMISLTGGLNENFPILMQWVTVQARFLPRNVQR